MYEQSNFTRLFKNVKNCKDLCWQEKAILSEVLSYQLDGKEFKHKDMTLSKELGIDKGSVNKFINRLYKRRVFDKVTRPVLSPTGGKPKRQRTITVIDHEKWTTGNAAPTVNKMGSDVAKPVENKQLPIIPAEKPADLVPETRDHSSEEIHMGVDSTVISTELNATDEPNKSLLLNAETDITTNKGIYDHIISKMKAGTRYKFFPVKIKNENGTIQDDEAMKESGMSGYAVKSRLMKLNAEVFK